jgi:hypothetical protein
VEDFSAVAGEQRLQGVVLVAFGKGVQLFLTLSVYLFGYFEQADQGLFEGAFGFA